MPRFLVSHFKFRTANLFFRRHIETVKTNDTGINLGDAELPKAGLFGDDGDDSKDEAGPMHEPAPEMEVPSPESIKERIIAAEDPIMRRQLLMTIQRYYRSTRFNQYLLDSVMLSRQQLTHRHWHLKPSNILWSLRIRLWAQDLQGLNRLMVVAVTQPHTARRYS
jgi:hypothetical protein